MSVLLEFWRGSVESEKWWDSIENTEVMSPPFPREGFMGVLLSSGKVMGVVDVGKWKWERECG